jgi:hypothetical protein
LADLYFPRWWNARDGQTPAEVWAELEQMKANYVDHSAPARGHWQRPDHAGGMGKACVYAPELTREAILDAIRARHTYGTTAARIFLDMRVNGHLMGDKIPATEGKPVEVKVSVQAWGSWGLVPSTRACAFG